MNKLVRKTKDFLKEYKELILSVGLICLAILVCLKILNKNFTVINDQRFQYDVFYREWYRLLKEFISGNGLPMYSWNDFLGSDFYGSMGYYVTGDIFTIVLFPLYLIGISVKRLLSLETFMCIIISSFSMYALLKKTGVKKKHVLVITSLTYAFCGLALEYFGQYMFHRFYAFLPLLFVGVEYYLEKHKTWIITLIVFILFLQNFYLMYPASIFLFIYCLAREWELKKEVKEIMTDAGRMILAYIIGTLLSAFITLPAIMYTLNNPRVGSGTVGVFYDLKTYCGLILNGISARMPTGTEFNDIFFKEEYHHSCFYLTVGIIYIVKAIKQVLLKEKRSHLVALLFLTICIIVKPLSSFMHGLSGDSFRWLFVVVLYLLLLGGQNLDIEDDKHNLIFIIYIALCLIAFIYLYSNGYATLNEHKEHITLIALSIIISVITWIIYKKYPKAGLIIDFVYVLVIGMVLTFIKINEFPIYYSSINREEVERFETLDDDLFHRYYISNDLINPASVLNGSLTLDYGFMTSKTYNTQYEFALEEFLEAIGSNWHCITIEDDNVLSALGTKYYLVYSEDELPEEGNFEYVGELTWLKVYEDLNYKGFGYVADKCQTFNENIDISKIIDITYVNDVDIDLSIYGSQEYTKFTTLEKNNNGLVGEINVKYDSILFMPIPNNKGWKVYVNGVKTDTIEVNGGFIGIPLNSGYSYIEMKFTSPYLMVSSVISLLGIACFIAISAREKKINVNE